MSDALNKVAAAIEAVGTKPAQKSGKGYRLQCSFHQGKDRNLYIADGDKRLIIKCYSHQCDPKDILEAAGLSIKDVYYEQLKSGERHQYSQLVTEKQIKKELEHELLILLCWIADSYRNVFPLNGETDRDRVKLAADRVTKVLRYFRFPS